MSAVPPGSTRRPDAQNPAAIRYARMMLQRLVAEHLIGSVGAASSRFGGDPTAAWRALSGLTGAPHTYMNAAGPGAPTAPAQMHVQLPQPHEIPAVASQPFPVLGEQPGQGGGPLPANPLETLMALLGRGRPRYGGPTV